MAPAAVAPTGARTTTMALAPPRSEAPANLGAALTPRAFTGVCATQATPQLGYGALVPGATWNDPVVLRTSTGWVMYASASAGFGAPVQIYRLRSSDARTWTLSPPAPVLAPRGASRGVETPTVVVFGGRYHMFYTTYPGDNLPTTFTVGHATSRDGVAWTVDTDALIRPTGAPLDWNGIIVGEPGAAVVGSTLHVYFTAVGVDPALGATSQVIGLVTSRDGVTFSAPRLALAPDRARLPRAAGWVGYSTPQPVVIDGVVHLFTDVASDAPDPRFLESWLQVALAHASSVDGVTGWKADPTFFQVRGAPAWTTREVRSVTPVLDGNVLRLWWAGDQLYQLVDGQPQWDVRQWGIGASTCLLQ